MTGFFLGLTIAAPLGAIDLICRRLDRPDPVDARAAAALDPRDSADTTACAAEGWVLDAYRYLDKERSK